MLHKRHVSFPAAVVLFVRDQLGLSTVPSITTVVDGKYAPEDQYKLSGESPRNKLGIASP